MPWNPPGGQDKDPWKRPDRDSSRGQNDKSGDELDEAVVKLKDQLNRIFRQDGPRGGSPGGGGLPTVSGEIPPRLIGLGAAAVVGIWLASGIFIVDDGQRGVVLRFGESDRIAMPGPHWHIPYPVETVEKLDVSQFRTVQKKSSVLTRDENIVVVDVAVQYNVKEADNYLFNVRDPDATIADVAESATREVVGSSSMDYVLTDGRTELVANIRARIQEVLDSYGIGLEVQSVNLQDAQPPEEVQSAFADAIKAREDEQRIINEAEAYQNEVLPRAEGDAARVLEEAIGYKSRVMNAAEGEAARFSSLLDEYRKAPEVTRERLYLETLEQVYGGANKVFVDVPQGGPMMYLPLDRLGAGAGGAAATSPAAPRPAIPGNGSAGMATESLPRNPADSRARPESRLQELGR